MLESDWAFIFKTLGASSAKNLTWSLSLQRLVTKQLIHANNKYNE